MNIAIVQPVVGSIGGNDMVLNALIYVLKQNNHEITLYTFSKLDSEFPGITIINKIPVRIPLLGIYQKFFMPKVNYNKHDLVISITGMNVKTKKPLIIYDQNNLGLEYTNNTIPEKYKKGFWRLYYQPYKMMNKPNINPKAKYISNSSYSTTMLNPIIQNVQIIYPPVPVETFHSVEKETMICMVSRISPEKNLDFAVRVLNEVAHHSVIFGNVTKANYSYFKKLRNLAKPHVMIVANGQRGELRQLLAQSKVYFHTGKETFGISVVEAIASKCIPIVPNNSAHPETVPVEELRYAENNLDAAVVKLCNAVNGNYDHRVDALKKHVEKFNLIRFENEVLKLLEK